MQIRDFGRLSSHHSKVHFERFNNQLVARDEIYKLRNYAFLQSISQLRTEKVEKPFFAFSGTCPRILSALSKCCLSYAFLSFRATIRATISKINATPMEKESNL